MKITNRIVEAYLNCKYKAYQLLKGDTGLHYSFNVGLHCEATTLFRLGSGGFEVDYAIQSSGVDSLEYEKDRRYAGLRVAISS